MSTHLYAKSESRSNDPHCSGALLCWLYLSPLDQGDHRFDLDLRTFGQCLDFIAGAGREGGGEEAGINAVDLREITEAGEEDRRLHLLRQFRARGLGDRLKVLQALLGLFKGICRFELSRRRIDRQLSGDEEQLANFDSLGIGADCARRIVVRGKQLVGSTSDLLKKIASHIDLIKRVVSDIATTAVSQAEHLDGFRATIREIDVSTQQTAAMAEQFKAACQSMESEAAHLLQLIKQFDFSEETLSGTHEAPVVHQEETPRT